MEAKFELFVKDAAEAVCFYGALGFRTPHEKADG